MKKSVNFDKECSVFLGTIANSGEQINFAYERPQYTPDQVLNIEAKIIFDDIKAKTENNINDLAFIYIARNKEQYKTIERDREIL